MDIAAGMTGSTAETCGIPQFGLLECTTGVMQFSAFPVGMIISNQKCEIFLFGGGQDAKCFSAEPPDFLHI